MPAIASADEPTTATIKIGGESGELGSVQISTLSEITFTDTDMVINYGDDSVSYPLGDISEITFSFSMSSNDNISADLGEELTVTLRDCVLYVTAGSDTPVVMAMYAVNGRLVASRNATGALTVDLNPYAKGIYIIKVNDKTIKFIR